MPFLWPLSEQHQLAHDLLLGLLGRVVGLRLALGVLAAVLLLGEVRFEAASGGEGEARVPRSSREPRARAQPALFGLLGAAVDLHAIVPSLLWRGALVLEQRQAEDLVLAAHEEVRQRRVVFDDELLSLFWLCGQKPIITSVSTY